MCRETLDLSKETSNTMEVIKITLHWAFWMRQSWHMITTEIINTEAHGQVIRRMWTNVLFQVSSLVPKAKVETACKSQSEGWFLEGPLNVPHFCLTPLFSYFRAHLVPISEL